MMRRLNFGKRMMTSETSTAAGTTSYRPAGMDQEMDWEMRPGGLLVQKRSGNMDNGGPFIRVRVAFGTTRFEISVNSQATFGELKKLLTAQSGLQRREQRVVFRGKEREDKEFLDISGVKDGSKVSLMEDPCLREKRLIEMQRNDKIQRAISDITTEIDTLAEQVSVIEKSISNGVKVAEVQITTLVEILMRKAVRLDSIPEEEEDDASTLKNLQEHRVRKCVESLDVLKISNDNLKPVITTTKWHPPTMSQWNLLD